MAQKEQPPRIRLSKIEFELIKATREKNETRVLCIGDLHEPFCLDGYLDFCIEIYNKHNCNKEYLLVMLLIIIIRLITKQM